MSEQDDRQLEDYLAGDSPLSEHYRQAGDQGPPASLDSVVLADARQAIAGDENAAAVRTPSRWVAPLSTAAVVVLAAALVLEITLPRTRQVTPESADVSFADESMAKSSTDSDDAEAAPQALVAGDRAREYAPAIPEEIPLEAVLRQNDASQATAPSLLSVDKPTDQAMAGTAARRDAKIARQSVVAGAVETKRERVAPQPEPAATRAPAPPDESEVAADSQFAETADARNEVELRTSTVEEMSGRRSVPSERGFFSNATGAPELSDARIQALTMRRIQWLVRDGQDEEAIQLLEGLLERWPDLVLPEDFPLSDPREAP